MYALPQLTGLVLLPPLDFLLISRSQELKLIKFAVLLNALAQRCTSWCHQLRSWVQTLGINQRESCASWLACSSGFNTRAGRCARGLFLALLFVVVAHQFSSNLTMRIPVASLHLRRLFFCDGGE